MSSIWPEYVARDLPLTRRQRKAVHRDAWKLWWANKWNIVVYLALPAFYLVIVPFASNLAGGLAAAVGAGGAVQKMSRAAGPILLFLLCFVLGGAILQRCRFAPCVYRALRRQGHDVCLECGYWLRGLDDKTARCPECGTQRATTV